MKEQDTADEGTMEDALLMNVARNMFESGAPLELWARLVCEAKGLDHNLPSNSSELRVALSWDVETTKKALDGE